MATPEDCYASLTNGSFRVLICQDRNRGYRSDPCVEATRGWSVRRETGKPASPRKDTGCTVLLADLEEFRAIIAHTPAYFLGTRSFELSTPISGTS